MDDNALREDLIWLYATDCGLAAAGENDIQLRSSCRQAIWNRLVADEVDFRMWISRLVRDMYLNDDALAAGHGIDEACEFWSWFDATMWTTVSRVSTKPADSRRSARPDIGPGQPRVADGELSIAG